MDNQPVMVFNYRYKKLLIEGKPTRTAKLLLVVPASLEEINQEEFLKYQLEDTNDGIFSDYYLLLIFQKENGELFTTIKVRHNPKAFGFNRKHKSKEQYYKELIGQTFKIFVNG